MPLVENLHIHFGPKGPFEPPRRPAPEAEEPFFEPPFEDDAPQHFTPVKRSDNPAAWITPSYEIPMRPQLVPDNSLLRSARTADGEIRPDGHRAVERDDEAILARGRGMLSPERVEEVRPALAGLRRRIAERRANRLQARIERLAFNDEILRFAGKSIVQGIQGENNQNTRHPLRPVTLGQRTATRTMGAIWEDRKRKDASHSLVGETYHDTDHIPEAGSTEPPHEIDFTRADHRLTAGERRQNHKNEKIYNKIGGQLDRRDKLFKAISAHPSRRTERLINHRNQAVRRADALRRHEAANQARRQARRDAVKLAGKTLKEESAKQLDQAVLSQQAANLKTRNRAKRAISYIKGYPGDNRVIRERKYHALWGSAKGPEDKPER